MLALVAALAISCGGGGKNGESASNGGSSNAGASRDGSLIITRPDGLYEFTIKSGDSKILVPMQEANSFVLDPAVSPSAGQIAYVVQPPPQVVEGRYDAGSDIWIANRDGSNPRMVFQHEEPNQLVRYPHWFDEKTLFAIIQVIDQEDGLTKAVYTLQRINVETGERSVVLQDVLSFDLSPDRSRIVFARLEASTGETLQAVDIDGAGNPTEVVAVSQNLQPFNSPNYSSDGKTIAFASADQTQASAPGEPMVSARPVAVLPDGLPEDIWTVDADGGSPQIVADIKEDIPALAWGGDGEFIYVIGAQALYEVNLDNGAVSRIGEGSFHGQIAWAPGG
jgi:Tol biopolymer transport system component